MTHICSELCQERKVPSLTRGAVHCAGQSTTKGLVVCPDGEKTALQKVPEVGNGQVDDKQLSVESAIFALGWRQLL